jgi:DnaJ-class molecular chaperone
MAYCHDCNGTGLIRANIYKGKTITLHKIPCIKCNGTGDASLFNQIQGKLKELIKKGE